jgi:hypothetical protein
LGPEANQYRKKEGLPPVAVGTGGFYSDPIKDSEEESPELVQQFFADTNSEEQERQRRLREEYRPRCHLTVQIWTIQKCSWHGLAEEYL